MIDPLADGLELQPFYDLMVNPEDAEGHAWLPPGHRNLFKEAGIIPAPLFDTQIAAMVCGFGDAVGYENLIKKTTGGKIDKGSAFHRLEPASAQRQTADLCAGRCNAFAGHF